MITTASFITFARNGRTTYFMERLKKERKIIKKLIYCLKIKYEREHILNTLDIRIHFAEDYSMVDLIPDMIGFPEDNTKEFDLDFFNKKTSTPQKGKRTDFKNMFSRDQIKEKIYEHLDGEGDFNTDDELIDWLYSAYVHL